MSLSPMQQADKLKFGCQIPFAEPSWYQGNPSPYYNEGHRQFRIVCRNFIEQEIKPNLNKWIDEGAYPLSLHERAYELGLSGMMYPTEWGGAACKDYFYELILLDEMARMGGGSCLGQLGINSMALPPIMAHASDYIKNKVCRQVITGKKNICLAISEPGYGSDVAGIETTAKREGDFFIVNGSKKWITGGLYGDFFTCAVRTGGKGAGGVSLLLLEKEMPGIKIRRMKTQFDTCHNTTFITLEDVKVPVKNLIGKENMGFMYLMTNFNHERFVISVTATRGARLCYEESIKWSMKRETFGKKLHQHQIIRFKLAEMARQIECLQDMVERVAFQFSSGASDWSMGGQCALVKVQASKVFEYCAREASQIFGGNSIVREGQGQLVERLYREVRASAIPGGSEEILLDMAMRMTIKKGESVMAKSNL